LVALKPPFIVWRVLRSCDDPNSLMTMSKQVSCRFVRACLVVYSDRATLDLTIGMAQEDKWDTLSLQRPEAIFVNATRHDDESIHLAGKRPQIAPTTFLTMSTVDQNVVVVSPGYPVLRHGSQWNRTARIYRERPTQSSRSSGMPVGVRKGWLEVQVLNGLHHTFPGLWRNLTATNQSARHGSDRNTCMFGDDVNGGLLLIHNRSLM
jgi:hypothetical protein